MENNDTCDWCGREYNPAAEGHYDENTNLNFCNSECEDYYDEEYGLPDDYVRYECY